MSIVIFTQCLFLILNRVSHSNDGEFETDPRLVKIPSADYNPGDERPVR